MKKLTGIMGVALVLVLVAIVPCRAENKVRAFVALTGGGTGAMDAVNIAGLENGDIGLAMVSDVFYTYQYHCPDTTAEASPFVIRPDDYGGTAACGADGQGTWQLSGMTAGGAMSGKLATVVNSDTASYSVTAAQARAGTFFLTTNTATTTYTLPAVEAGMCVCARMSQGNAQVLRIDTDGTDFIVISTGARTTAAGDYYGATSDDKNQVCVVGFDTTDWYVTSEIGTWSEE